MSLGIACTWFAASRLAVAWASAEELRVFCSTLLGSTSAKGSGSKWAACWYFSAFTCWYCSPGELCALVLLTSSMGTPVPHWNTANTSQTLIIHDICFIARTTLSLRSRNICSYTQRPIPQTLGLITRSDEWFWGEPLFKYWLHITTLLQSQAICKR